MWGGEREPLPRWLVARGGCQPPGGGQAPRCSAEAGGVGSREGAGRSAAQDRRGVKQECASGDGDPRVSEAAQRPAGWGLLPLAAQHAGGLLRPPAQEGAPQPVGPHPLTRSLLMAGFRQGLRPAPLTEAPVCGASRHSFRRPVQETVQTPTRGKKNTPSPALHWAITEECLGLVPCDGQGSPRLSLAPRGSICCLSCPQGRLPRPLLQPLQPYLPQAHLVCKMQVFPGCLLPRVLLGSPAPLRSG